MAILDEIKSMQAEGKSDHDITLLLQEKGYGIKEISDSLSQSKIKQAVSEPEEPNPESVLGNYPLSDTSMQQSMITQPVVQEAPQSSEEQPSAQDEYAQQQYQAYAQAQQSPAPEQEYQNQYAQAQQPYNPEQQYNPYSSNTDTISDIAEQVVAEKLNSVRKQLENAIALKTTTEAKITALDDRLKKLEKIIDRLQLSVLQKVGEYITNIDDIKREVIETQKSFKSLMDQNQKKEHKK